MPMDDRELLRRLCVNDATVLDEAGAMMPQVLDQRSVALVRLAGVIALSGPEASVRAVVDEAVTAGLSTPQIVAVLDGMIELAGLPRVVASAPRVAVALGMDEDVAPGDDV